MEVKILAKTTTVTMRVDAELKRQAELICEDIGLTPSAAYTLFLKAVVCNVELFPLRKYLVLKQ